MPKAYEYRVLAPIMKNNVGIGLLFYIVLERELEQIRCMGITQGNKI